MNFKVLLFIAAFSLSACAKDDGEIKDPNDMDDNEMMDEDDDENENLILPIVMVHGALASGDTYAKPSMLFAANAYPEDFLFSFDWNTLGGTATSNAQRLDEFVDKILSSTQSTKIVLIGHSAGGGLSYTYCSSSQRAVKVAKYVHIGSGAQSSLPGPEANIPTMNIYSTADRIVAGSNIPGAENVVFDDLDHYEVATSEKSFAKIYEFVLGQSPEVLEIMPIDNPQISGRVVSLGENMPSEGVRVEMYYVDAQTGERKGNAIYTFQPDEEGYFGPYTISSTEFIEFELNSTTPGFRRLYYYREPVKRNNTKVYLRTFPAPNSLAGILLSSLPKSDDQAVVSLFSANQAIIHQRDELVVQGINLANETLTRPENSTIAMFLYDSGNKESTGNPHAAFSFAPFLRGADIYFQTEVPETIPLLFNGRTMNVRNYKSDSEGVVIAVFD
jgi:hypothetical protein